jgi:hypothetical protein
MRVILWIKIIVVGIASAVIFTFAALLIDEFVRPEREITNVQFEVSCLLDRFAYSCLFVD